MTRKVALYLRVSTKEQTTDNQRQQLEQVCKSAGWSVVAVYEDAGVSGSKGRDQRPGFDTLLKDAVTRKFDLIMAWSVDRLGRSLQDLVTFLAEIHALKIDLYLHIQGLDTTTPAGKALFQMLGVFAEFERSIIKERVNAGLDRARAEGKRLGRPPIPPITVAKVQDLRRAGLSIRAISKRASLSVGATHRILSDS